MCNACPTQISTVIAIAAVGASGRAAVAVVVVVAWAVFCRHLEQGALTLRKNLQND